jgi:hypothetical protein
LHLAGQSILVGSEVVFGSDEGLDGEVNGEDVFEDGWVWL